MAVGIVISAVAFVAILYASLDLLTYLKRMYVSTKVLNTFPSEKCPWFLGHLAVHPGATHEGLLKNIEWVTNNPRYYTTYMGPIRAVLILNHPETIKQMLKTAEPKARMGGGGYTLIQPWLGDGLLLSSGEKWFRNRRLLTPGFHFEILKPYMAVYNGCVERLMNKIEQSLQQGKQSMEIFKPVSLCTLDIILRCAFSTEKDVQGQGDKEPYVNTITSLSRLLVGRALKPHLYFDWLYYRTKNGKQFKELCEYSHDVAFGVMNKRKAELAKCQQKSGGKYVDFLDILLLARDETGNGLSDVEIRDEVVTFMFEGHDTTASGISWILYNLATHPAIQERARAEVDAILNGRDSDVIEWNDLGKLTYVTMCIKESLRTHPPVHFISRETTKSFHMDDKILPPHTLVNISIWNVHHNPEIWPDPMIYDPDRFLPHNIDKMDSHAFIPFSAGPRNCIGQNFAMNEMKTTVARVLRKFEFKLDSTKPVRMMPDVVLRAESGIHVLFEKRSV